MKMWATEVSIDMEKCDPNLIKKKDKIQDYVIQLCKKLNIERSGDCQISTFASPDRQSCKVVQFGEFSLITGYFAAELGTAHISLFNECPIDIPTFEEFTTQFFGSDKRISHQNNKYLT